MSGNFCITESDPCLIRAHISSFISNGKQSIAEVAAFLWSPHNVCPGIWKGDFPLAAPVDKRTGQSPILKNVIPVWLIFELFVALLYSVVFNSDIPVGT